MAIAYMAIAKGSPWVVPSVDGISPLPVMNRRTGCRCVLMSTCARREHNTLMLWRAEHLLMELKAKVWRYHLPQCA